MPPPHNSKIKDNENTRHKLAYMLFGNINIYTYSKVRKFCRTHVYNVKFWQLRY